MLSSFTSQKFKFWAFVSMVLLVFVHGYNLKIGYLQPWTMPEEPMTFTTFTEYFLSNGILRFRIPMLFIISGYLFAMGDTQPHKQRVKKRARTLLLPYIIWSAFGLLTIYLLESFAFTKQIVTDSYFMQIDEHRSLLHQYHWYEVLFRWLIYPVPYQLWFIRVLFIYNLAYPALRWCVTHPKAKYVFFAMATLMWLATAGFHFFEGEGLLFFSLGVWMQKINFNIEKPNKWLRPKIWFLIFLFFSAAKTWLAFQPHFNGIEPILMFSHKLVVFSGFIAAWYGGDFLVKFFMQQKWFVWTSAFSFMIYVLHAPIVIFANQILFLRFDHLPFYRIIIYVALPLALVAISIGMGALLRSITPKLYGLLTGGRGLA
jgi:fucose 4-O-acetylase-like acetyltransferase